MQIQVKRKVRSSSFSMGEMFIENVFFCYTLEDKDRKLKASMPLSEMMSIKIPAETAIPTGNYELVMSFSNRFQKFLPQLLQVPCFEGIRIHAGNISAHTEGCILLGYEKNEEEGMVLTSRLAVRDFISRINTVIKSEKIFVEVK